MVSAPARYRAGQVSRSPRPLRRSRVGIGRRHKAQDHDSEGAEEYRVGRKGQHVQPDEDDDEDGDHLKRADAM